MKLIDWLSLSLLLSVSVAAPTTTLGPNAALEHYLTLPVPETRASPIFNPLKAQVVNIIINIFNDTNANVKAFSDQVHTAITSSKDIASDIIKIIQTIINNENDDVQGALKNVTTIVNMTVPKVIATFGDSAANEKEIASIKDYIKGIEDTLLKIISTAEFVIQGIVDKSADGIGFSVKVGFSRDAIASLVDKVIGAVENVIISAENEGVKIAIPAVNTIADDFNKFTDRSPNATTVAVPDQNIPINSGPKIPAVSHPDQKVLVPDQNPVPDQKEPATSKSSVTAAHPDEKVADQKVPVNSEPKVPVVAHPNQKLSVPDQNIPVNSGPKVLTVSHSDKKLPVPDQKLPVPDQKVPVLDQRLPEPNQEVRASSEPKIPVHSDQKVAASDHKIAAYTEPKVPAAQNPNRKAPEAKHKGLIGSLLDILSKLLQTVLHLVEIIL